MGSWLKRNHLIHIRIGGNRGRTGRRRVVVGRVRLTRRRLRFGNHRDIEHRISDRLTRLHSHLKTSKLLDEKDSTRIYLSAKGIGNPPLKGLARIVTSRLQIQLRPFLKISKIAQRLVFSLLVDLKRGGRGRLKRELRTGAGPQGKEKK
jgi:hypothetical protein